MKVLIKTIAGSHLFGTNTEQSDTDYRGVFVQQGTNYSLP